MAKHMGSVAIVDDEENIRETVAYALRREGYHVDLYRDGQDAWERFGNDLPDVAVLDILMPRMDGLELCRKLRGQSERLPIIFLTSKDEEFDRVLGLELGADDYLCKPFAMRELVARIKVLFRRLALAGGDLSAGADGEEVVALGPLCLDMNRYQATWKDAPLSLTVTEFMLLHALARRPGHVKSRAQLMQECYPHDAYVSERTIDSHVKRLRKKFGRIDPDFDEIDTVYGLGYRYREHAS
ncbi:MAG: response regulator transcription factor [Acidobacteriota bacterium]|nr:MAG: response regulator transcription factor [Acidobacteriota bacterium]